ncbi:DUF3131 domain-containing protein [Pseudodesulfovibrio sp. JC047]|uniref:DUF3131 domain-containing protein n=1 Tax=Pseudodesulfovibrio sp. JC047 TaxID=2683199 RepID=UPI0013D02D5C|nr:DUF3131 domain-containing protein [Pseudodesulfovibrio sp. JC047]NDV19260.1 DUF3131 domain-containing protein [Pseudodesulfovibrio sp. JC047]
MKRTTYIPASAIILFLTLIVLSSCRFHYYASEFTPAPTTIAIDSRSGPLTESEQQTASQAWAYFDRTVFPETGLPQGAVGSDTVTMWDIGSYLAAMVCAKRLDLLDEVTFDHRMTAVIYWLNTMQLNEYGLPNTYYNARTGAMIQRNGQPGQAGFSSQDIGRLLIWLRIIRNEFITHATTVDKAMLRFNFRHILDSDGLLHGAMAMADGSMQLYREGRLGLQQYAAAGFGVWGFTVDAAMNIDNVSAITILDEWLPFDSRPRGIPAQLNAVTTRMGMMAGLELGFLDFRTGAPARLSSARELADAIYQVQEARFMKQGRLTARDPHVMDRPPYYLIDSLYADGIPFVSLDGNGNPVNDAAAVSTKAAYAMWALYDSPYTDALIEALSPMFDEYGGWFAGFYEKDGAINRAISLDCNAVILEALAFKVHGMLYYPTERIGFWEKTLEHTFFEAQGLPPRIYQGTFQPLLNTEKARPTP